MRLKKRHKPTRYKSRGKKAKRKNYYTVSRGGIRL